jgi:hypothetical protein
LVLFNIYKIIRNYLSEYYGIDSAVLLALIRDKELDVEETLYLIPFIHSGYLSIVVDIEDKKDGN